MSVTFLPTVETCCGCCSLGLAVFFIFIWDLIRAALSSFEFFFPLCHNYSRAEGFGLFMKVFSGVVMGLAIILALLALWIMFETCLAYCANSLGAANFYIFITFLLIIATFVYYVLYFFMLEKTNSKCDCNYTLYDGELKASAGPDFRPVAMIPAGYLFFHFIEANFLIYYAIVINSFEERLEFGLV